MANSLGGINLADIAARTINALTPVLLPLRSISTDFSAEFSEPKESITTRIATSTTADDVSGGFTADDQTSTAKTITLNKELGKAIGFTQAELSKGGEDRILRTFAPTVTNAVGLGVIQEVIKLCTNANVSNVSTVAAGAWDVDDVADIAQALDEANVPQDRFMMMKPAYFTALAKDDVIQHVDSAGSDETLRRHQISMVHGFQISQFNGFPTGDTTASENLTVVAGGREGLLIGGRFPAQTEAMGDVVAVENVLEPETGFPFQFQQFYVPKERKHYFAVATLFGVAIGNADNLRRVKSS